MSLMSLPSELRARIIEFVILSHHGSTSPVDQSTIQGRKLHPDDAAIRLSGGRGTFHEDGGAVYNLAWQVLVLVNRQMCWETKSRLAVYQDLQDYELHVAINSARQILPTWVTLPLSPKHINNLNVTFHLAKGKTDVRTQGSCPDDPDVWGRYARHSPSFMAYELFNMLSRILKDGPRPIFRGSVRKRLMIIQRLQINVISTADIARDCAAHIDCPAGKDQQAFLETCTADERYSVRDTIFSSHPECFCYWLSSQIEHLLGLAGDFGFCGLRATAKIGSIQLCYNNVLWKEFDLGRIIVDFVPREDSDFHRRISGDDEAQLRVRTLLANILSLRRSNGLPVPT